MFPVGHRVAGDRPLLDFALPVLDGIAVRIEEWLAVEGAFVEVVVANQRRRAVAVCKRGEALGVGHGEESVERQRYPDVPEVVVVLWVAGRRGMLPFPRTPCAGRGLKRLEVAMLPDDARVVDVDNLLAGKLLLPVGEVVGRHAAAVRKGIAGLGIIVLEDGDRVFDAVLLKVFAYLVHELRALLAVPGDVLVVKRLVLLDVRARHGPAAVLLLREARARLVGEADRPVAGTRAHQRADEGPLVDQVLVAEYRALEYVLELFESVRVGDVDAELALGPPDVRVVRAPRLAVGLVVDVERFGTLLGAERLLGITGRPAVLVVGKEVEPVLLHGKRDDLRPEIGVVGVARPHPLERLSARLAVLPVAVPVLVVAEFEEVLAVRVLPEDLHRAELLLDPVKTAVAGA